MISHRAKLLLVSFILLSLPVFVQAQTTPVTDLQSLVELLQAQVKALQEQVVSLQAQLQTTKEEIAEVKTEFKLAGSLARGASGDGVRQLQEFLKTLPDIYPEGLVTGYFGPLTEAAVKKFQEKQKIETVGAVGPKTLARINELISEGAGRSEFIPPGLLLAPGIQAKLGTTTPPATEFATATLPVFIPTTTTIFAVPTTTITAPIITTSTQTATIVASPPVEKNIASERPAGPPAIIANKIGYGVVWVDTAEKNLRFTAINLAGDTVIAPRTIYAPGVTLWKYVAIEWTGTEYGISVAVKDSSGWQTYLLRVDREGNAISSTRLGGGGTSPYSGPAITWDGNEYGIAWNSATNNGVHFARYSGAQARITTTKLNVISSSRACDVAIDWGGDRFGVMCNGLTFFALDIGGNLIVSPTQMACTKDSIQGFAWQPSMVWDGSKFQVTSQYQWGRAPYLWYGTVRGNIHPDGSGSGCYGDAKGVSYPIYRSSITFAPELYINTATNGKDHGIGIVSLDKDTIKLSEYIKFFDRRYGEESVMITDTRKDIASGVEMLGNIVWGGNRYAIAWSNSSGIQLTLTLFDMQYQPPARSCSEAVYYCWKYGSWEPPEPVTVQALSQTSTFATATTSPSTSTTATTTTDSTQPEATTPPPSIVTSPVPAPTPASTTETAATSPAVTSGVPAAPSGLTATLADNGSHVNLFWIDNSNNESKFKVLNYRRLPPGESSLQYRFMVGPNITSAVDLSVLAGTYDYLVSACDSYDSCSQYSNTAVVTVTATTTVAVAPPYVHAYWNYGQLNIRDNTMGQRIILQYPTGSSEKTTTFRLYAKNPGDSSFGMAAEFTGIDSTSCSKTDKSIVGQWILDNSIGTCNFGNQGTDNRWNISYVKSGSTDAYVTGASSVPLSSYSPGEYSFYIVAVNSSGQEGNPSEITKLVYLNPLTITYPTANQVLSSFTPTFQWTMDSATPSTLPRIIAVFDSPSATNPIWSPYFLGGSSKAYGGPPLYPAKQYIVSVYGTYTDTIQNTATLIMPSSVINFSVTTATSTSSTLNSFTNRLANISVIVSRLEAEIKKLLGR